MDKTKLSGYQFGWFKGVFTPSVLTIFGVVMYLRFGWVLGNVGLPRTLLIVLIANGITLLTALSLSALATNMRVAGGGAYYIISRSLGLEAGAAIGWPLFLAQAVGISFYVAGFSESFVHVFPAFSPVAVGVVTLAVLTLLASFSADLALKSQYLIMAAIALSLVSFFAGRTLPPAGPAEFAVAPVRLPFWAVFAVFFPAVTGIEAGIAMSGDLRNPARALPLGTLAACLCGLAVYLAIPVFLSFRVEDATLLLTRPLIMRDVARVGDLIVLGIWGASLSSAMGSLLGAPRTLQALARDGVAPRVLARGFGKGNDPRIAGVLCFGIALVGVLLGDLNRIAPVLAMFFLTSYAFLNLSAGLETLLDSPSWRPQFRVPAAVSLAGSLVCAGAMLMIDAGATIVAVLICALLYGAMQRRRLRARWGDLRRGIMMSLARRAIRYLDERPTDERSWQPNLLVLSGLPTQRPHLIELAAAIVREHCLATFALVLPESTTPERTRSARNAVREHLRRRGIPALVKVVAAADPFAGGRALIDTYGFGPLKPNTLIIGGTAEPGRVADFTRLVRRVHERQRNFVLVRERAPGADPLPTAGARADVWWRGGGANAGFMLALAHLLRKGADWHAVRLTLNAIAVDEKQRGELAARLSGFIGGARLNADVRVFVADPLHIFPTLCERSRDARVVFLGLRPPADDEEDTAYGAYYERLYAATDPLPLTALCMASEQVDFRRIFQ